MTLEKRGKYHYGETLADIREEIARQSTEGYPAQHFAEPVCPCGSSVFRLKLDGNEGVAVRTCIACSQEHPIADSDEYLEDAELEDCTCPCGADQFQLSIGVALYEDSEDVRWLYVGARCSTCGLTAVYGDWKNECLDYAQLLSRV